MNLQRLETQRRNVRRLYNQCKRTGNWDSHTKALTEYSKAVREAKRSSWKNFCQDIDNVSDSAKLQRVLARNPVSTMETVLKEDCSHTEDEEETLAILLSAHFSGSTESQNVDIRENREEREAPRLRASRDDWVYAKSVVTYGAVKRAIESFEPFKAPGADRIIPAMLQQSVDTITPKLMRLFRLSLATGVIPSPWEISRVVFIPKLGKPSYDVAKAYRPISLMSFLLKTMEKVIDRCIRVTAVGNKPLHPNQQAYQSGKSCETVLAIFLDIEGAFDNMSTGSIVSRLESRGTDKTIIRWIRNMLSNRKAEASLCGDIREVKTERGCPQGGVLSPRLWNLVVDRLLVALNDQGMFAQGYADDIVILITGKQENTWVHALK
nr:unnamed protein product [Callosobruchus chinensis]